MKGLRILPLLMVLSFGVGFTACGGDSADDLKAKQTELDEREARMDEMKALQRKQNLGTATAADEARLAELYALLEEEGENPEGGNPEDN